MGVEIPGGAVAVSLLSITLYTALEMGWDVYFYHVRCVRGMLRF